MARTKPEPKKKKAIPIEEPKLGPDVGFDGLTEDGKKVRYRIHTPEEMGIARMVQFNKEAVKIAYGLGLPELIASHLAVRKHLNKADFVAAAVENENQIHRLGDLDNNEDPHMKGCALFICREDEDLTKVPTEAERNVKIEHWNNAGIPYGFFIGALGTFNHTLKKLFESTTPTTLPSAAKNQRRAPSATNSI